MSEAQQLFQELLYGEGAWLGFILIIAIIFLASYKNKYLTVLFIPLTIMLGITYLENIPGNSNLTWVALLSFLAAPFLLLRLAKER